MTTSKISLKKLEKLREEYRKDLLKLETVSDANSEYAFEQRLEVWELVFDILNGRKQ